VLIYDRLKYTINRICPESFSLNGWLGRGALTGMWYIYTASSGNNYPIEIGYRAVGAGDVVHDYEFITSLCKNGCRSYNSGGCPPWAPRFEDIEACYPYGVLVYAKFLSKFSPLKPGYVKKIDMLFGFQDMILSKLLTQLGYVVTDKCAENVLFLNNGHCRGCDIQECSFKLGESYCRYPERRTYSIGATGVDVSSTLKNVFGIELQWYTEDTYDRVEYITKMVGFFCQQFHMQNQVLDSIVNCLNALKSTKFKIGSDGYRMLVQQLLA